MALYELSTSPLSKPILLLINAYWRSV